MSTTIRTCPRCDRTFKDDEDQSWWSCCPQYGEICEFCAHILHPDQVEPKGDPVNHPSHYNRYEGLEVIDLTEQMNFNRGNAVKYICRAGMKGDDETEFQDLEKAIWYLQRELQRMRN